MSFDFKVSGKPLTRTPGTELDTYKILIRDLVLSCGIGVYPQERTAPQRVRFNLEIVVDRVTAETDDDINNVVSYEGIVTGIKQLCAGPHINLVETLAERVADICLAHGRVVHARVRVEKLDIFAEAGGVGVEIERTAI